MKLGRCMGGWLVAALVACGGEAPAPPAKATGCAAETRADTFGVGLRKTTASGVVVSLAEAKPAPPAKGDNYFTLRITDASGAPIDDATVSVLPYMPDHGHGSALKSTVTSVGSDGRYTVSRMYLPMAGYWEITFTVTRAAATEEARFGFCLDG